MNFMYQYSGKSVPVSVLDWEGSGMEDTDCICWILQTEVKMVSCGKVYFLSPPVQEYQEVLQMVIQMVRDLKHKSESGWLWELGFFLSLEKKSAKRNLTAIFVYLSLRRSQWKWNQTHWLRSTSSRARRNVPKFSQGKFYSDDRKNFFTLWKLFHICGQMAEQFAQSGGRLLIFGDTQYSAE